MNEPNLDGAIYKRLDTPEATYLAELYLLQGDLNAAYAALELYFDEYALEDGGAGNVAIISASLFRDGVLLYCSVFSTSDKDGVKLKPEAVYGHQADWEAFYTTLTDMRHAFVAHNFGPQRQHNIVVACVEIEDELQPAAFTQFFIRFGGWAASEKTPLLSFIDTARNHLEQRISEAEAGVMNTVAVLTPKQLNALPIAEVTIPSRKDFRTSRAAFRKKGGGSRRPLPERRLGRTTVIE